jgi:lipopolysaccharide/colanic/teichoic acid biosynthesis glycosyltransferase
MHYISDYLYFPRTELLRCKRLMYPALKSAADVLIAAIGAVLLAPLFLVIAAAIKLDSPGPVIFCQKRVGLNGKVFVMYKFRTMAEDSDVKLAELHKQNMMTGHMFKIKDDPRITRVGKVLRKTSLDEFPQLFNVLKGDMSLVGPRPPLVWEFSRYEGWHSMRLAVKPGMTGLWQISGRNSIQFSEMVMLDFRYIRERSFLFDLKLILRTLPLLLGDKNAY